MIFFGVTPGGTEIALPAPAQAQLDSKDDAPADSFTGVFSIKKSCGSLTGLKIRSEKGETLLDGTVDIQREISSGNGNLLKLTARSRAGLLLDSEAIPQSYEYPSLPTIYARHVGPYGFSGWKGSDRFFKGSLRITKGMSEWQAAALFCKTFLLTVPRVRGGIFDASGISEQDEILFDNTHGTRFYSAEIRNRYCDRYSELLLPDAETGAYISAAKDAETSALGILRNRCLSKNSTDAAGILKAADRKAFAVIVDCPGEIWAETGRPAALNDPMLGSAAGLTVSEICCTMDSNGIRTKLVLRKRGL